MNTKAAPDPGTQFKMGPWIVAGIAVYAFTAYGTYLYRSYRAAVAEAQKMDVPADVSDRYDSWARTYDEDIEITEWVMGMGRLRRKLARKAHGDVLEASAGTGRNLQYYPLKNCRSLTLVDKSRPMVEQAKQKASRLYPKDDKVEVRIQDALEPGPLRRMTGYDTVIQTMGLCSTHEPVQLLKALGDLTKRDGGQILLLEHGRSHYAWLNTILDSLAKVQADRHGCWWNRDVGRIVEESGLEVVALKRYHFGTTWWIELRRARSADSAQSNPPT